MNREAERKRLVELLDNFCKEELGANLNKDILEKVADNILDDGWMRPPVKVGQKVYYPSVSYDRIFEKTVDEILINENESDKGYYIHFSSTYMPFENIGKTVFTSREEAVKMLKGEEK